MTRPEKRYYIKDYFTLGSTLQFSGKIPVFINSRTVTFKMDSDYHFLLNPELFQISGNRQDAVILYIHYDETIFGDGYSLDITSDKTITVRAKTGRGVRYAQKVLCEIVQKKGGNLFLPIALIADEPDFLYRGIIEGYYGEPWSSEERLELADFMDEYRMNTYLYAPKMDPYHRQLWHELYPEEECRKLKAVKDRLAAKDIDFYYCLSPGYAQKPTDAFLYTEAKDFERLYRKIRQLIDLNITHFGLLLDDIDYTLSGKNKEIFQRPGIAHAYICNQLNQYLKSYGLHTRLIMCPTEYHQIGSSEYRDDLKRYLEEDIIVFWTGDNVCAEVITNEDAKETRDAFGRDLFIWDNFPVSDFTYGVREFLAPVTNRSVHLSQHAIGYVSNPSRHYQISKIGMITMAHYAWNSAGYDPDQSFRIALQSVGEGFYEKGMDFIRYNYPSVLSYGNLDYELELVQGKDSKAILAYVHQAAMSAAEMLKMNYPIITELSPWLKRCLEEEKIMQKIFASAITKEELLRFFEDIHFSGSELLDFLVKEKNLFTDEEYQNLIKKRRGNPWYRVFEYKRWPKK